MTHEEQVLVVLEQEVHRLRVELTARDWQPIETMPEECKDGRLLLLGWEHHRTWTEASWRRALPATDDGQPEMPARWEDASGFPIAGATHYMLIRSPEPNT